jgi:hypothetical protein
MSHPQATALALFAGGELPWWMRWRVRWHLGACETCRREVEGYRRAAAWFRETAAELPPGFDWERAAAEMRANIQLGLEAGECVPGPERAVSRIRWRVAAAVASIAVVVLGGWWLHMPHPSAPRFEAPLVASTSEGIQIREPEGSLTLLNSGAVLVMVSASAEGAMTARFIDEETGLVTVNHVSVE